LTTSFLIRQAPRAAGASMITVAADARKLAARGRERIATGMLRRS
jgi:hypothetical protein